MKISLGTNHNIQRVLATGVQLDGFTCNGTSEKSESSFVIGCNLTKDQRGIIMIIIINNVICNQDNLVSTNVVLSTRALE